MCLDIGFSPPVHPSSHLSPSHPAFADKSLVCSTTLDLTRPRPWRSVIQNPSKAQALHPAALSGSPAEALNFWHREEFRRIYVNFMNYFMNSYYFCPPQLPISPLPHSQNNCTLQIVAWNMASNISEHSWHKICKHDISMIKHMVALASLRCALPTPVSAVGLCNDQQSSAMSTRIEQPPTSSNIDFDSKLGHVDFRCNVRITTWEALIAVSLGSAMASFAKTGSSIWHEAASSSLKARSPLQTLA